MSFASEGAASSTCSLAATGFGGNTVARSALQRLLISYWMVPICSMAATGFGGNTVARSAPSEAPDFLLDGADLQSGRNRFWRKHGRAKRPFRGFEFLTDH